MKAKNKRRWVFGVVVLAALSAVGVAPGAQPGAGGGERVAGGVNTEANVVAVYDISGLTRGRPPVVRTSAIKSLDQLGRDEPPAEALPKPAAAPGAQPQQAVSPGEELAALLRFLVMPEIWTEENSRCAILFFGDQLIVNAPKEAQTRIAAVLESMQANAPATRDVNVEIKVVLVQATVEPSKLGTAELEKLAGGALVQSMVTGPVGQDLRMLAGKVENLRLQVTPVVSDNVVGYQTDAALVLSGLRAQVRVLSLSNESARLMVTGSYSGPIITVPENAQPATAPSHFSAEIYEFSASRAVPVGQPVLLGSTTLTREGVPSQHVLIVGRVTTP
jgi:hypothetical protein